MFKVFAEIIRTIVITYIYFMYQVTEMKQNAELCSYCLSHFILNTYTTCMYVYELTLYNGNICQTEKVMIGVDSHVMYA